MQVTSAAPPKPLCPPPHAPVPPCVSPPCRATPTRAAAASVSLRRGGLRAAAGALRAVLPAPEGGRPGCRSVWRAIGGSPLPSPLRFPVPPAVPPPPRRPLAPRSPPGPANRGAAHVTSAPRDDLIPRLWDDVKFKMDGITAAAAAARAEP